MRTIMHNAEASLVGRRRSTGTKVHAFTSGTMVQIFQLVRSALADIWNRN
jgi:hypothetical protein